MMEAAATERRFHLDFEFSIFGWTAPQGVEAEGVSRTIDGDMIIADCGMRIADWRKSAIVNPKSAITGAFR